MTIPKELTFLSGIIKDGNNIFSLPGSSIGQKGRKLKLFHEKKLHPLGKINQCWLLELGKLGAIHSSKRYG